MKADAKWSFELLSNLGLPDRPVLKAGPFGSSVVKSSYAASGHKLYGQQEVLARRVDATDYYVTSEVFRRHLSCSVRPGDVLITTMGTVGRTFVVPADAEDGIINPRLMRIAVDHSRISPDFLDLYLSSSHVQKLLDRRAHGGTMSGLNSSSIGSIRVPLPPLPEQRKIAEILRTWDYAIEKTLELRRLVDVHRAELAERMLAPSHGARRKLSELTSPIKTRNSTAVLGRASVMGVSNRSGLVPMRAQTIAADISRYQILPPRAFAYNPMRINVGSIAMSQWESDVLVSPDYVLFQCDEGELRPEYLDHVLRTRWWLHHVNAGASGSVRTRTYYDDLAAISIAAPPIAEQDKVSRAFDGLDREMELLQRRAELLRTQKRGLMQKLLTGQVRVNVTAGTEPGGQDHD